MLVVRRLKKVLLIRIYDSDTNLTKPLPTPPLTTKWTCSTCLNLILSVNFTFVVKNSLEKINKDGNIL